MCSSRNRRFVPLVFAHFKNKKVVLKSYQVPLAVQLEHTRRRNTHRGDEDDDVARTATRSPGSGMCCCYSRLSLNGGAFADGRSLLEACIAALRARRLPATVKSGRTERERKRVRERERLRVFLLLPLRPHLHFSPFSFSRSLSPYIPRERSELRVSCTYGTGFVVLRAAQTSSESRTASPDIIVFCLPN